MRRKFDSNDDNRITSETDIEEFKRNYGLDEGTERRSSDARETQLRKFAQLRTKDPETDLRLTENPYQGFAHVKWDEEDETFSIEVTKKKIPQHITDLPREYFDYLYQKGLTVHEVGHVLYTDFPSFQDSAKDIDREDILKSWWNLFEDGAIENFLAQNYRVSEELDLLRANMSEAEENQPYVEKEVAGEEKRIYYMKEAIDTAIYDLAIWNTGRLGKLLDPDSEHRFVVPEDRELFVNFVPTVRAYTDAIVNEPDGPTRNKYIRQFYDEAKKLLDESDASEAGSEAGDVNHGAPDDAQSGVGPQQEQPGESPSVQGGSSQSGQEPASVDVMGGGSQDSELPGEERSGAGGGGDDKEEKAEKEIQREIDQLVGSSLEEEIEKFIDAMGAGDGEKEIYIPNENDLNEQTYRLAVRRSQRLSNVLQERLRMSQKSRVRKRMTRGKFDPKQMIRASRGYPDVFTLTEEGDEKDYSAVFIKDSSGSTSRFHDEIELSTGTMMLALEGVGVDTCLLDVENSHINLAKPFGSSTEQYRNHVFNGSARGGTPLRHAIWFARERINMGSGTHPFIVVVTDGRPYNEKEYREELRKCNFPVVGLYIDKGKKRNVENMASFEKDFNYFHNQACVFDGENTLSKLNKLCRMLMF